MILFEIVKFVSIFKVKISINYYFQRINFKQKKLILTQ